MQRNCSDSLTKAPTSLYLLCTNPSVSVLFQRQKVKHTRFEDLDAKSIPFFLLERSITVKKFSIRRKQVPMCPAFSLTYYKVQGSSFSSAVLDLHDDSSTKAEMTTTNSRPDTCNCHGFAPNVVSTSGKLLSKIFSSKLLAEMERLPFQSEQEHIRHDKCEPSLSFAL